MKRMRLTAAALAALIVIIPIIVFMPHSKSGTHAIAPDKIAKPHITEEPFAPPAAAETPFVEVTPELPAIEPFEPDALEVEALARMLYGEARGVASDMEKAACVWCVLNRVDDPRFPDTVLEVLEAPYQFSGYSVNFPVLPELAALAADVLTRYHAERGGDADAGRVLPAEYVYFTGDGRRNHFTTEWRSKDKYDWTLENPYDD